MDQFKNQFNYYNNHQWITCCISTVTVSLLLRLGVKFFRFAHILSAHLNEMHSFLFLNWLDHMKWPDRRTEMKLLRLFRNVCQSVKLTDKLTDGQEGSE